MLRADSAGFGVRFLAQCEWKTCYQGPAVASLSVLGGKKRGKGTATPPVSPNQLNLQP